MQIEPHALVADLATQHPGAIRVFQRHKIDFCCGGQTPLSEVCAGAGLAFEDLKRELESAMAARQPDQRSWTDASLQELTDHIVKRYHASLREELPRLTGMMERVLDVHGNKHPAMLPPLGQTFDDLRAELDPHMMKEEMVLFPLVLELERTAAAGETLKPMHCGSIQNPIRAMEYDHENAGQALAQMRELTADYTLPEGACNTFRALFHGLEELEAELHEHIHLENNVLHPRAKRLEQELSGV